MTLEVRTKISGGNIKSESLIEVETERIEMKLNTESSVASGLLIQRLTELYEDPIAATIRETVSNALDATSVSFSGSNPEVRISLPTNLRKVFIVEDNGVGMSYEDLKNVYSKYGASTKIDNFDQIGAYGLGAKAPLAYGTEFTVASTKDGITTTVIVVREELTNYIKVVSSEKTGLPSGTKVSIPILNDDIEKFHSKVNRQYKNSLVEREDVHLYIDNERVSNNDFNLLKEDFLILDGKEKVYGRVWIKKGRSIVNALLHRNSISLSDKIEYVIGGWSYKESSFIRVDDTVYYLELKPGVVSFNSSRDSILDNERFQNLKEKFTKYLSSDEFFNDVLNCINESPIEEFKETLQTVFSDKNSVEISNDFSVVYIKGKGYPYDFIKHKETGYNISSLFEGIPKEKKKLVSFTYKWTKYLKEMNREYLNLVNYSMSQTELIRYLDRVMLKENKEGNLPSENLKGIIYNLFTTKLDTTNNFKKKLLIITDLDNDKDYLKVRKARRRILEEFSGEKDSSFGRVQVVFTEYSKDEIANYIKSANIEDCVLKSFSEIDSFLKKNRSYSGGAKKKPKSVFNLSVFKLEGDGLSYSSLDKIKESREQEKRILVIAKTSSALSYAEILSLENAFKDKEGLSYYDEVETYLVQGKQRKADLETLEEITPYIYYRDNSYDSYGSRRIGDASYVIDFYKERSDLLPLAVLKDDPLIKEKSFMIALSLNFVSFSSNLWLDLIEKMNKGINDLNNLLSLHTKKTVNKISYQKSEITKQVSSLVNMKYISELKGVNYDSKRVFDEISEEMICLIEDISLLLALGGVKLERYTYHDEEGNKTLESKRIMDVGNSWNINRIDPFLLSEAFLDNEHTKEDFFYKMVRRQSFEIVDVMSTLSDRISKAEI